VNVIQYGGNYESNGYISKPESSKSIEVCGGGAAMRLNRLIISIVVAAVVLSALPSSASAEIIVTSCDMNGIPKEAFNVGDSVHITATGLKSNVCYYVIIQDHPVTNGDIFNISEDPSKARWPGYAGTKLDFFAANDSGCSESPVRIWGSIPSGDQTTYDIVVNAFGVTPFWRYTDGIDGLDSVGGGGGGFVAPVPELPTLILTAIGLIGLIALGRRR